MSMWRFKSDDFINFLQQIFQLKGRSPVLMSMWLFRRIRSDTRNVPSADMTDSVSPASVLWVDLSVVGDPDMTDSASPASVLWVDLSVVGDPDMTASVLPASVLWVDLSVVGDPLECMTIRTAECSHVQVQPLEAAIWQIFILQLSDCQTSTSSHPASSLSHMQEKESYITCFLLQTSRGCLPLSTCVWSHCVSDYLQSLALSSWLLVSTLTHLLENKHCSVLWDVCDSPLLMSEKLLCTCTNGENTFNFECSSFLAQIYKRHINSLNDTQSSFTESQLKENCPRPVDLDAFRNIRKQLTDFYVLGAKVHNMTEKVKKGQTDYLMQIKLDVIPNILPPSFIQQVVKVKKDTEHRSANANETWFWCSLSFWRVAAFISSPIHLLSSLSYLPIVNTEIYYTVFGVPVSIIVIDVIHWHVAFGRQCVSVINKCHRLVL